MSRELLTLPRSWGALIVELQDRPNAPAIVALRSVQASGDEKTTILKPDELDLAIRALTEARRLTRGHPAHEPKTNELVKLEGKRRR